MARKYTKVAELTEATQERKARGETNREIGESYGLSKQQVKQLIDRQNRKERKSAAGYIPRPKGRPRKEQASEEVKRNSEIVQLRMQSDQGSPYTSQAYFDLTREYRVSPSISSPGCPYDNAAMENSLAP